jgi:hypothetical protein
MTAIRPLLSLLIALSAVALGAPLNQPLSAQTAQERLAGLVDAPTYDQLTTLLAQADSAGLPTGPLVQKALEGHSKGANDRVLLDAVDRLLERLRVARAALGDEISEEELASAAAALYVGATPEMLRTIRQLRAGVELSGAYTAFAYLLQQGVQSEASIAAIGELIRSRAGGPDFVALQQLLAADIVSGVSPAESLRTRVREIAETAGGGITPAPVPLGVDRQ